MTSYLSRGSSPDGIYHGTRAISVQSYLESNCKLGSQFEISSYLSSLPAGANADTIVITGNLPILIKSRQIGFDGAFLISNIYQNPTYSGGTVIPYYNLNTINPISGLTTFIGNVTVTNPGTQIGATTFAIGSTGQGTSRIGSFGAYATPGLERVLAPNSVFLFRVTNPEASAQKVMAYATWFEGQPDLPSAD